MPWLALLMWLAYRGWSVLLAARPAALLAAASFVSLLIMLIAAVFVLPVITETSGHGVLLFNILLLSVFFSGIFSTRSVALISVSAILFSIHLALRLVRFGENPYSFYVLENVIGIANTLVFIFINLRLLFRDRIVNAYRIVGAVNVYLLFALMGAWLWKSFMPLPALPWAVMSCSAGRTMTTFTSSTSAWFH